MWALIFIAATHAAFAVVGGTEIRDADRRAFQPLLSLTFDGAECTGTHLGKGLVLTSHHCLSFAELDPERGSRPKICFETVEGKDLGCARIFKPHLAPGATFHEAKSYDGRKAKVASPDLLVLEVESESLRGKLATLDAVELASAPVTGPAELAGQGCSTYATGRGNDGKGTLRRGAIERPALGTDKYLQAYHPGGKSAGACAGDSGGPFFRFGATGRMAQYAVTGSISIARDDGGRLVSVSNHFARVDVPAIGAWLRSLLR